jgi:uncharacterized lipoprotein YmbA
MTTRAMALALVVVVIFFSGACSFLKAKHDPTRYFVLTPSAKPAATPVSVAVGLDRVELPEYLVRPELVTRSAANQLQIAEYEVWGEPLRDGFKRTLRRDLEDELGGVNVVMAPFDPAARPELAVDVEVHRFERVAGEGAVLDAGWTLRDVKSGNVVARRDAHERQPSAAADAQPAVAALSRDVAALAAEIAVAVRDAAGRRR